MKRHDVVPGLATVLAAAALGWAAPHAHAEGAASPPALTAAADSLAAPELRLRLAVTGFARGDLREVVAQLGAVDFADASFADADRAAVLLGHAYRELGAEAELARLAEAVARWPRTSPHTEALARTARGSRPDSGADADATGLGAWLRHRQQAAAGSEDEGVLAALAAGDTSTSLGRDLAAAAAVRLATRMLARGEDPRPLLDAVPQGSRHGARARHMSGLVSLERGDRERGRRVLAEGVASDSGYAGRREALRALAGDALEAGEWDEAVRRYAEADADWTRNRDAWDRLRAGGDFEPLWSAWRAGGERSEAIHLDAAVEREHAARAAAAAADLTARAAAAPPAAVVVAHATGSRWPVAPPPAAAWDSLAAAERRLADANFERLRCLRAADRERERLAELRRYLGAGLDRLARDRESLAGHAARLDSLRATLAALDARLRAVRDTAGARVARRTAEILARAAEHDLWLRAMRHFHLDGPRGERLRSAPAGLARPDSLLAAEEALLAEIVAFAARVAGDAPDRIAESYEKRWRPDLIDRATALGGEAGRSLAWAGALSATIDSNRAASGTSRALRVLEARAAHFAAAVESLALARAALRDRIAGDALARARADLDAEREGIDYGLAASAYARSVRPERADSASAVTADADTVREDDAAVRGRDDAIAALRTFLAAHPASAARGEMRFRLADLMLMRARQAFREQMAGYVRTRGEGGPPPPLPVLDPRPALDLYRAILAEDRDFPHRDAVLFNAGMILADEGDAEAMTLLGDLVASHPGSAYVQEARLRMGDLQFQERGFRDAIALYEGAAAGPDPGLRAVALYKMGWAHFNEERFLDAADAFRGVLDLYAGADRAALAVDVERETESDFVQSLARAGGAPVFAKYFDGIGRRPYEKDVLLALGQHFRRYSLHAEAAAVDEMCLGRYPREPEALVSAQRLVETHRRWERPDQARRAQLEYAPRFAPGSDWSRAQAADSLRAAGSEFARTSLQAVALHHHGEGRARGTQADWREAQRLYERILAGWPGGEEAPVLELGAGEASARLGEHERALAHYAAAAASPRDSVAAEARWQRVAVTDAWYETTRVRSGGGRGSDSLARAVLDEGDALLAKHAGHAQSADLLWRQGHLAFAHGWFARSAAAFDRMAAAHPADARVPVAAALRADALFRLGDYEAAGAAFEAALVAGRAAGRDSLVRRAAQAIPVCYFRHAESVAETDSTDFGRQAELFARVAERWPGYEHAPLARYRAGLAWLRAGRARDGIRAMESLVADFPRSEYVKDARLQIARTWEAEGERERAAAAYVAFSAAHPADESARPAWLRAADLFEAAGLAPRADELRVAYLRHHPEDVETGMEILAGLSRRELAAVGPERPVSTLLPRARRKGAPKAPESHLAEYLRQAEAHPQWVSRELVARVRFLQGEEAAAAFAAARLTQPLEVAIAKKQELLDQVIPRYREAIDLGASEWASAAAFRIGQTLIAFGDALRASERPADLQGDDLRAYEDVLDEQARAFDDRGEEVWEELLRQRAAATEPAAGDAAAKDASAESADPWVPRARSALWLRLGGRFAYRPEVEFPLVEGDAPEKRRAEEERGGAGAGRGSKDRGAAETRAQHEGGSR